MIMPLNADQIEQIRQAKAHGARRVTLTYTPAQKQAWQAAFDAELAGSEENVAQFRKIKAAAELPGFFGDVRRAILLARCPLAELATAMGVDCQTLSDFRAGEAELTAASLDRLIEALGLRLMQEIPR